MFKADPAPQRGKEEFINRILSVISRSPKKTLLALLNLVGMSRASEYFASMSDEEIMGVVNFVRKEHIEILQRIDTQTLERLAVLLEKSQEPIDPPSAPSPNQESKTLSLMHLSTSLTR